MPAQGVGLNRRAALPPRKERTDVVKALVVADGEPGALDARYLAEADLIVAADGGAGWLAAQQVTPHILIGDFDSIEAANLEALEAAGVTIERHPIDKDQSDAQLALDRAVAAGADHVTIVGALAGERLDHALSNLLMVADPAWKLVDVRVVRDETSVRAVSGGGRLILEGASGDIVTLLAIGDARGVTTEGLAYPLAGERLRLGESRGLSNVIASPPASVRLEAGTLLVVEIHREDTR
jgi:thiamine pyrophosphokinase